MTCYKLTDPDGYTRRGYYNETLWGEDITHTAEGEDGLCSDGVIHAYADPKLALFMNPAHANIENPLLWECEGENLIEDDGTKQGYRTLTTIKRIEYTKPSRNQCIRFGILCAKQVFEDEPWNEWADKWLGGTDRTANAAAYDAYALADSAANAAYAAAYAAANAASWAAYDAAAKAAYYAAATYSAYAAYAAYDAAANAANAANAAKAANAAYDADKRIDFAAIAKQSMEEESEPLTPSPVLL